VLVAGMKAPRNLGPDYAAAFDAIYPRLAERHGALLYPFLLDGVAAVPALNQPDGLHPNREGIAVIVARILPSIEGLLAKVAAK
jgi:acyl-CoA thioesterase-1